MALRRDQRLDLALAVLAPAVLLLAAALGAGGDVLLALPTVLCAVPLLLGRYVGEQRLERLARAVRARRRRRAPRDRRADLELGRRRPAALVPRGGALIAASLAVRPPPPGAPIPA
jgi:hypothetical protein